MKPKRAVTLGILAGALTFGWQNFRKLDEAALASLAAGGGLGRHGLAQPATAHREGYFLPA